MEKGRKWELLSSLLKLVSTALSNFSSAFKPFTGWFQQMSSFSLLLFSNNLNLFQKLLFIYPLKKIAEQCPSANTCRRLFWCESMCLVPYDCPSWETFLQQPISTSPSIVVASYKLTFYFKFFLSVYVSFTLLFIIFLIICS